MNRRIVCSLFFVLALGCGPRLCDSSRGDGSLSEELLPLVPEGGQACGSNDENDLRYDLPRTAQSERIIGQHMNETGWVEQSEGYGSLGTFYVRDGQRVRVEWHDVDHDDITMVNLSLLSAASTN